MWGNKADHFLIDITKVFLYLSDSILSKIAFQLGVSRIITLMGLFLSKEGYFKTSNFLLILQNILNIVFTCIDIFGLFKMPWWKNCWLSPEKGGGIWVGHVR